MTEPPRTSEPRRPQRARILRRAVGLWTGVLGAGHLAQALLGGAGVLGWALGAVALAVTLLAFRVYTHGGIWEARILAVAAAAQGCIFALTLTMLSPPFPMRGLLVALASGYVGLALLAAALVLRFPEAGGAALLALSSTVGLLGLEVVCTAIVARMQTATTVDPTDVVRLRGAFQPDSVFSALPAPGSHVEHVFPDNPRGYFEKRTVDATEGRELLPPRTEYVVAYDFNSRGCRGREYDVPASPGTFRIVVLGDSYVMGWGVHYGDMLTTVLERLLDRRAAARSDPRRFEVISCAMAGFSTKEERLYYELHARAYEPDLVLLGMVHNDDRSSADENAARRAHSLGRWKYLFRAAFLFEEVRHAHRGRDFSGSMEDLALLQRTLSSEGIPLGVFSFADFGMPRRSGLLEAVQSTTTTLRIPFLDLATLQTGTPTREKLTVHRLDGHPNEIVHRASAEQLMAWLFETGLIPS